MEIRTTKVTHHFDGSQKDIQSTFRDLDSQDIFTTIKTDKRMYRIEVSRSGFLEIHIWEDKTDYSGEHYLDDDLCKKIII